jgi:hypothetical protein
MHRVRDSNIIIFSLVSHMNALQWVGKAGEPRTTVVNMTGSISDPWSRYDYQRSREIVTPRLVSP